MVDNSTRMVDVGAIEDAIDSSKADVLKLVADIIADGKQAKQEAWQEGYDKGHDDGYTAGHEDGKMEAEEQFKKPEKVKFT